MANNKDLKRLGYTDTDIKLTGEALMMLRNTFTLALFRHHRMKQLKFLTDNDIMGDDEWIVHLAVSWQYLYLSTMKN